MIGSTIAGKLLLASAAVGVLSLGVALQPAAGGRAFLDSAVSLIGIGGIVVVGMYRRRVDEHTTAIEALHREKASKEQVDGLCDRFDDVKATIEHLIVRVDRVLEQDR